MAHVRVTVVHDMFGKIVSISRPGKGAAGRSLKSVIKTESGQSVFETEVDEEKIGKLITSHRVDVGRKSLVSH